MLPCRRVAEKAGHADQKFLEEEFHLLGILLQIADIGGDPVDLVNAHAPLDPAVDGVLLVQGEVVAGLGPQQDEDFLQGALVLLLQGQFGLGDDEGVPEIVDDLSGQILRRGDQVGQPGLNGAPGHAVELGRGRLLHQRHSRLFLDGPQPHRAVRAHAGEDDADAALLPVLGQGAQEEIDGETQAAGRRRFEQVQHAVQNGHVLVGGDHIDAVRLDPHPVPDLKNLHRGGALEQFGHDPLVGRVQVLDDDKGHAAIFGHMPQELFQRLQPAGGGADADNRKKEFSGLAGVSSAGRGVFFCTLLQKITSLTYPPCFSGRGSFIPFMPVVCLLFHGDRYITIF